MSDMESLLKRAERLIESMAKKFYSVDGYDYEDILQIGRMKVWEIICSKEVTEENFQKFVSYILMSLKNLYGVELRKTKAQKRVNLRESVSLDAEIGEENENSRYDLIPDKGGEITFETLETIKAAAMSTKEKKAIRGVIWCLVELLDIPVEEAPKKINYDTFGKFNLRRYLWVFFNNSPFRALRYAYHQFEPSDMKRRPNGYWKKGKVSTRQAIAELKEVLIRSGYEEDDYPLIANGPFIADHGLRTPLDKIFSGSPYHFLDAVFPGRYMPWQMGMTPATCFNDPKEMIRATRWLVEDILGFKVSEMDQREIWKQGTGRKIKKGDFEKNGLRGILNRFNNRTERIIRFAYPDKFLDWDLPDHDKWSRGEESLELAARATKWVIEDYAGLEPNSPGIGYRFFASNGLHGMITSKKLGFNSSPKAALKNAYPKMKFEEPPSQ